jgi:HEAT repeat protein
MAVFYCDQCWAENEPGAEQCASCGANLREPQGDWVDRLTRSLGHPVPEWRAFAAYQLGCADDDRAAPALCRALESEAGREDSELLIVAAAALGRLRRASSVGALSGLAKDSFIAVRLGAVKALAAIGTSEALAELEHIAVSDCSVTVRECAEAALQDAKREV